MLPSTAEPIGASLIDVADDGVGISVNRDLPVGTTVTLQVMRHRLPFTVAWCLPSTDGSGRYTCGLVIQDRTAATAETLARLTQGLRLV